MKHSHIYQIILLTILSTVCSSFYAQQFEWARGASGNVYSNSVVTDGQGNSYVTGWYEYNATFGSTQISSVNGSHDIFLAKYDNAGNLLWVRSAGGTGSENSASVALDQLGNCYITGEFQGTAAFGTQSVNSSGGYDIFVAKYSPVGEILWVKKAGGADHDFGLSICKGYHGALYITGYFSGTANFGSHPITSISGWDIFLARIDTAGQFLWSKGAGGLLYDYGTDVAADTTGNAYLTGYFSSNAAFDTMVVVGSGSADAFISKADKSGKFLWVKQDGGSMNDYAWGITSDHIGNSAIAGYFEGTMQIGGTSLVSAGNTDVFLISYNTNGEVQWAQSGGGSQSEYLSDVFKTPDGSVYITGRFEGSAGFQQKSLTSFGSSDAFVIKYSNAGNVEWATQIGSASVDYGNGLSSEASGHLFTVGYHSNAVFGTITNVPLRGYITKINTITGVKEVDSFSPDGYVLNQNYPNPFNPSTNITFQIAKSGFVSLKVYDVLGNLVKVLVHQALQKGSYEVGFGGEGLAGGVYLCRLEAGDAQQTMKMLLLK